MGWQKNFKRYADMNHADKVRFKGAEGTVHKTDYYARTVSPAQVAVVFNDGSGLIHHLHTDSLEIFVPDPPAKQYVQTDYYQEKETGAVFKRQFSFDAWHLISVTGIRPSIKVTSCEADIPEGFKRLYKEA